MHGLFRWSSKWWPGTIPLVIFWAIAAWTSTGPLESDLAARSTAALKDTVLDKSRVAVAGRDLTFAADAFSEEGRRSALAAVEAVPGVRLVGRARRRQGHIIRQFAAAGEQRKIAGGGPCGSRRRRGGRSDEFVAGVAAAFRQCGAVAARPGRETEGRQDHNFGQQGQPLRHGARSRRPGSDRGRVEKPAG